MGLMKRFYSEGKSGRPNTSRYDRKYRMIVVNTVTKSEKSHPANKVVRLSDFLAQLDVDACYRKSKRKREWVRSPRYKAKFKGRRRWKRKMQQANQGEVRRAAARTDQSR